ncbi:MAG: TetR/AcrR family transcriptional regulator [candidate division Zixibacteria bacterium]|nr:TetR/AcrR family transcriptional regulator [candidate division Zixibacteria bacterium]
MTRKTMERQTRQQYIIDAARRLLAEKGIEDTSMEDIAAAVEYTRRTLYAYFKSRDEIYLMILVEDLKSRWAEQKKALTAASRGLDKIRIWGESLYDYSREHPHSMPMQIYWDFKGIDRDRVSPEVFAAFETINEELAAGLREIFTLGINDGSLRPDLQIDMAIGQFVYSLRSIINRALTPTYSFTRIEPDKYVEHYLGLFLRGIQNKKE